MTYQPRHARRPDPASLPPAMRGLADLITITEDKREDT